MRRGCGRGTYWRFRERERSESFGVAPHTSPALAGEETNDQEVLQNATAFHNQARGALAHPGSRNRQRHDLWNPIGVPQPAAEKVADPECAPRLRALL